MKRCNPGQIKKTKKTSYTMESLILAQDER